MATCKTCGAELAENAKFCPKCGSKIEPKQFCSSCGAELQPNAKFCPKCGSNQLEKSQPAASQTVVQNKDSVQQNQKSIETENILTKENIKVHHNSKPKSKKKKWIIIGVIAFIVLVGIVLISGTEEQSSSSSGSVGSGSEENTVTDYVAYENTNNFYDYMESCISRYEKVHVFLLSDENNKKFDGLLCSGKNNGADCLMAYKGKYVIGAQFFNGNKDFTNGGAIFSLPNEMQNVQNYWNILYSAAELCKDNGYCIIDANSNHLMGDADKCFPYVHVMKGKNNENLPFGTCKMAMVETGGIMFALYGTQENLILGYDNVMHSDSGTVFNLPRQQEDFYIYMTQVTENIK